MRRILIDIEIPDLELDGEKILSSAVEDSLESILQESKVRWKQERSPRTEQRWRPRVQPTGSWPILRETGLMQDTAEYLVQRSSLYANVQDYGVKHQTGSEVPQREWLGIPDSSLREIENNLAKRIFNLSK